MALFASGADWDVEEAGRDGERYWVSWETSCGEAGVPGSEAIFSATWGDLGSTWAYSVAAHDVVGRAELLAAFAVAAATTGPAEPPSDEQLAAEAALLTLDDLVGDWVPVVRIPSDDAGFDELATPVLRAESTCAAAVAWADREGLTVSGLVDALVPDAVARAESPTFTSMRDGSEIEHAVSVWANPAVVAESFATARDVDWMACIVSAFGELMVARLAADGIEVEIVDYSASALAPQLGDDALGARFEMTAEAQGEQVTIVSSLVVVAIGEVPSAVSFFAVGGDASFDVDALAAIAADRVAEVFGVVD